MSNENGAATRSGGRIRIGIVGLGFGLHLYHTLIVRNDCAVVAVCDHDPARLAAIHPEAVGRYASPGDMVREARLDAIVIASPPHHRRDALAAAIDGGLPVFLEKPVAGTPAQARDLAAFCGDHPIMVGFSFRFHAPARELVELVSGPLGAPRILNAEYLFDWVPEAPWIWDKAKGGGFLNENSCHLFDVVAALMGRPETVYAAGFDDGARPSATGAALTMTFASGAVAALTCGGIGGSANMLGTPRLDVACAGGRAEMRGQHHMWTDLEWDPGGTGIRRLTVLPEMIERTRYSDAFDHFFAAINEERPFKTTLKDGALAVEIADAAYRSIESRAAVRLEEKT
ncbi:MAG: Gfo/Idh/MocA family oxidoreductase [Paracoccaceae bacterium]|nr:Gfo/Idh/MocA family oxidoreductase [Paracoccaceae bacterium]